MKPSTTKQRQWAADGLAYTIRCYEEWTREGLADFTPMLRLLDHIRSLTDIDSLSSWTSLVHLSVASASHVMTQYNLTDGAPCLSVTQEDNEFAFIDASSKRRKCPFENAADVFDVHLVRLKMHVDEFDAAKSRITKR
jgi:hypothetical protein